jgi:predicted transposase/invertase (TIGR01784 family)
MDEDKTDEEALFNWLRFIKSEDEEEMEMLAQTDPAIGQAFGVLRELSTDEKTRLKNEARLKFLRDQYAREYGAKEKGYQEGHLDANRMTAQNFLAMGIPAADVAKGTGLTLDEVLALQDV